MAEDNTDVIDLALRAQLLAGAREVRHTPFEGEMRTVPNGTGGDDLVFTGYACITGTPYHMEDRLGPWSETIARGAFKRTLDGGADVAFLVNHEGLTLARTKSGTLTLAEDDRGLHTEARLDPRSPYVQALQSAVERGDLDEMSFAFRVTRQEWSDDQSERMIREVNIHQGDVSAVNYGANPHTGGTVSMRGVNVRQIAGALIELREGRILSGDSMSVLQQVLDMIAAADENVDEAQIVLSELMGVPNPDDDESLSADDSSGEDDTEPMNEDGPQSTLSLHRARLALLRLN